MQSPLLVLCPLEQLLPRPNGHLQPAEGRTGSAGKTSSGCSSDEYFPPLPPTKVLGIYGVRSLTAISQADTRFAKDFRRRALACQYPIR
jgi:hypothetical protein